MFLICSQAKRIMPQNSAFKQHLIETYFTIYNRFSAIIWTLIA